MITAQIKPCSRCQKPRDMGKNRYCRACHAAYMREHRKPYSQETSEERRRRKAREKANLYQKRGHIKKMPCRVCGTIENLEKHHEDYSKPLEVIWLCRRHHIELHLAETPTPSPQEKAA